MSTILAYLDPGSSSLILQMIGGGVAALAVAAKVFWHRILTFLHLKPRDDAEKVGSSEPDAP
jgi:hypothetical protein